MPETAPHRHYNRGMLKRIRSVPLLPIKAGPHSGRSTPLLGNGPGGVHLDQLRKAAVQADQLDGLDVTALTDDEYIKTAFG